MVSSKIQNLAQQLLDFEAAQGHSSQATGEVAVQVIGELRLRLVKLVGMGGFRSLLSRALTLAKAEIPSLHKVHIRADSFLEGFDGIEQSQPAEKPSQGGVVLLTHLLELLVTFIGEPLTLRLVRDAFPNASVTEAALDIEDSRTEGKL